MAEETRKLDVALGGDEVPLGPLGGPVPKTREQLLEEQEARETEATKPPKAPKEPKEPANPLT